MNCINHVWREIDTNRAVCSSVYSDFPANTNPQDQPTDTTATDQGRGLAVWGAIVGGWSLSGRGS